MRTASFALILALSQSLPVLGTPLTRDAAIREAVTQNPQLAVAMVEIARANSRLRWAGRLDNPELELSSSTDQLGLNEDEGTFEVAFSQRFPITSRLRDEKVVRRQDVQLAEIEFAIRQRQLAYAVDKAWVELRGAQRTEALLGELFKVNTAIAEFLSDRSKLGEVSSLEATQAALNGKLLEQELGVASKAAAEFSATFGALLGRKPGTPVTVTGDIVIPKAAPSIATDLQSALANRPDYQAVLASKDLGQAKLSLAMSQRWEDIAVKVFAERERVFDAPEGLERNTLVGVGVSIPLPLRNRNQQAIEEARIDIERARRAQGAKAYEIHSELRKALEARRAAFELLQSATSEALPLAKKNFEAFRAAQQNGQASPLQVQQAQAQLLQLENSALQLRKDYELLDAEVRFLSGTYPIARPVPLTK